MGRSLSHREASPRRLRTMVAIALNAVLLTVAFYAVLETYLPADSIVVRYCTSHPVEYTEVLMFFTGLMALALKAWGLRKERRALRAEMLPAGHGQPAPEASALRAALARVPLGLQNTLLARRLDGALEFVSNRGSTEGLDDYLRSQAETDADAMESSYGLIRFITWAIPILGFLGTVLGITAAIANVTPEELSNSISGVTNGLALAFDATALALTFAIGLMFLNYLVERSEQNLLQAINARAEQELLHRFERLDTDGGEYVGILRQQGQQLLQATERLVERQAEVWSRSLEALRARQDSAEKEQSGRLAGALEQLLERTVAAHQHRLVVLEKKAGEETGRMLQHFERVNHSLGQTATAFITHAQRAAEQAELLGPLLESEQQILRLQETMYQNLRTLAQTGAFEQALHSLTAAIHLLTARAEAPGAYASGTLPGTRTRQGNAA